MMPFLLIIEKEKKQSLMSGIDLTSVLLQAALTLTTRFVGFKLTEYQPQAILLRP